MNWGYVRASLDRVVVYGCPPEDIRICNRVSLNSLPLTPDDDEAAAGAVEAAGAVVDKLSVIGLPSRRAFFPGSFLSTSFLVGLNLRLYCCLSLSLFDLI